MITKIDNEAKQYVVIKDIKNNKIYYTGNGISYILEKDWLDALNMHFKNHKTWEQINDEWKKWKLLNKL